MKDHPESAHLHRYEGSDLVVLYDKKRCIHAAACVRGLPAVFDPQGRPWVQPDNAGRDEVLAVVERCPSGALSAENAAGERLGTTPDANTVEVSADGPLYLRGRLTVVNAAGEILFTDTRLALCRCGASKHKPFCDNSHLGAEFVEPGPQGPLTLRNEPESISDPGLKITLRTNGSLFLEGPFEVRAADGSPCGQGTKTSLCRCGHSAKKPLCDGTHNKVGFIAE